MNGSLAQRVAELREDQPDEGEPLGAFDCEQQQRTAALMWARELLPQGDPTDLLTVADYILTGGN